MAVRRTLAEGRGWGPKELDRREARQVPLATKQEMAHVTIKNDKGLDELRTATEAIFDERIKS
jgi:dephospho-CoA kinase